MLLDIPLFKRQLPPNNNTSSTSTPIPVQDISHELVKRRIKTQTTPTPTSTITPATISDDPVTVYTHVSSGSQSWSINFIIPTITTNSLPSGYTGIGNNSLSNTLYNISNYRSSNYRSSNLYSSSLPSPSSSQFVSTFADLPLSSLKIKSSSTLKNSKYSSHYSLIPITSSSSSTISSSATSSSSLSTSSKSTTTVTEYLDTITYTQVYVVTDSKHTLTTSFLATTSIYVDSLSLTYAISPPAITTDINSLRSRSDFSSIWEDNKLSKGKIAGITIGSIIGFLLIASFILFYFFVNKRNKRNYNFKNFFNKFRIKDVYSDSEDTDDDYDDDYDNDDENLYNSPHIPDRSFKPVPPPIPITNDLESNKLSIINNDIENPKTPINNNNNLINNNNNNSINPDDDDYDDFDMSLFDMKSKLNEINASSEINNYLIPPVPPARKSLSSNRIDKLNYKAKSINSLSSQLPIDRTMGVLYESPNEQVIWDEFESAKSNGLMINSNSNSPIDSVFGIFDDNLNFNQSKYSKSNSYIEQLNINGDYDERLSSLSNKNFKRVRSGSEAKRYEHLANNVNNLKNELEKERLSSPLTNLDYPIIKKEPPPIPKPRKNTKTNYD